MSLNITEKELLDSINLKQESGFRVLFKIYRNYLVLFANRRINAIDVAEDIVQDVFLTIWTSNIEFNSLTGLKAYLYQLVQNKCLNHLKHNKIKEKFSHKEKLRDLNKESNYLLMQEEIYREIYSEIMSLPEKCRMVFSLYMEGYKNDEIAEKLNISPLTVKSHKQNALRFLKKRLIQILLFILNMNPLRKIA